MLTTASVADSKQMLHSNFESSGFLLSSLESVDVAISQVTLRHLIGSYKL